MKSNGLTVKLLGKLIIESKGEADGILGVGVKSVEIKKNTHCESDLLELN